MFHKIKSVAPLPEYRLLVSFAEGLSKTYDMKPLPGNRSASGGSWTLSAGPNGPRRLRHLLE